MLHVLCVHNNIKTRIGWSLRENDLLLASCWTKPYINCALNMSIITEDILWQRVSRVHPLTKSSQLANRLYYLITRNIHFASNNVHSTRSLLNRRFSIICHRKSLFNNASEHVRTT